MLHIALYQPEIPPNTGNIMRLCANTGCALHLVKPLGFSLEEKQLRRAGLDYRDIASVTVHDCLTDLMELLEELGEEYCLRVPMKADSRSLNLSNTVALVAYEGLRQLGFGDLN